MGQNLTVIVLAAGGGTRMKSKTMKVLHRVGGRSMIGHVLNAVQAVEPQRVVAVVGHQREQVGAHIQALVPECVLAVQEEQHGTGDAVRVAIEAVGDGQRHRHRRHRRHPAAARREPARVRGGARGGAARGERAQRGRRRRVRLRPHRARRRRRRRSRSSRRRTPPPSSARSPRSTPGSSPSTPAFLVEALPQLGNDNAKGEYYLTDTVQIARDAGLTVGAHAIDDGWQTAGVNDREELAALGARAQPADRQRSG